MRSKARTLAAVSLLLLGVAGCDRAGSSTATFSGGNVSMRMGDVELKVADGKLQYSDYTFEVPDPSSKISVRVRGEDVTIEIDGKIVHGGK